MQNPLRIGLFSRHYHVAHKRGISIYTHELTRALAKLIHAHDVFMLDYFWGRNHRKQFPIIDSPNFKGRVINCPGRLFEMMNRRFHWPTPTIGMQELHLVHILHEFEAPVMREKKVVMTVHDLGPVIHPELFVRNYREKWIDHLERGLRRANRIIGVSRAVKEQLEHFYPEFKEKYTYTFLGVSEAYLKKPDMEQENIALQQMKLPDSFILYIGAGDPKKNIEKFMEGYAIYLQERHGAPAVQLVFTGYTAWGGYEKISRSVNRLRLKDHIHYTGYVGYEHLPALYRRSKLFVLPSIFEGFGLPLLEAMAAGTPCLVSKRPSLDEVGGEIAAYFDPDSPEDIAQQLKILLSNDELLKEMRRQGRRYAQKYTWERTARETLRVYEGLLGVQLIARD